MVPELGANRFAFLKASCIDIEYSNDGGATWTDYGAPDYTKMSIFINSDRSVIVGNATADSPATPKSKVRITLSQADSGLASSFNKFIIYVQTDGSSGCSVTIQKALNSDLNTFTDVKTAPLSGLPGYNVINLGSGLDFGNHSSHVGKLRFVFSITSQASSGKGLMIRSIGGYGGTAASAPSVMAKTGHLYKYDPYQNAVFPGEITASHFNGEASRAIADGIGQNIINTYLKDVSASGSTITLTKGNGTTSTIQTQDTTYEPATEENDGLMTSEQVAQLNSAMPKSGGKFTGPVTVKGFIIDSSYTGVAVKAPTADSHITNKKYVDETAEAVKQEAITNINNSISLMKGKSNGLATLDDSGKVPSSQLPSYVDDVLEYTAKANFPTTGESGKIYVDTTTNLTYRWSGSAYVEISKSLAIGTTANTAAAGNHTHQVLTVKGNGTTAFTYDGGVARSLNIKPGTCTQVSSDSSGNITISASHTHGIANVLVTTIYSSSFTPDENPNIMINDTETGFSISAGGYDTTLNSISGVLDNCEVDITISGEGYLTIYEDENHMVSHTFSHDASTGGTDTDLVTHYDGPIAGIHAYMSATTITFSNFKQVFENEAGFVNGIDLHNLQRHLASTNNPHNVTAEQINAAPLSHVSDTNNPHNVTAAQVGAATVDHTHNDVEGYTSVDVTKIGSMGAKFSASTNAQYPASDGWYSYAVSKTILFYPGEIGENVDFEAVMSAGCSGRGITINDTTTEPSSTEDVHVSYTGILTERLKVWLSSSSGGRVVYLRIGKSSTGSGFMTPADKSILDKLVRRVAALEEQLATLTNANNVAY